jgi:hypothetical protein
MNILLQDSRTGLFLRRKSEWTPDPGDARAFLNRFQAFAYKVLLRLPRTCTPMPGSAADTLPPKIRRRPLVASAGCTLVEARLELGPGNTLFIRGEGEGLSWHEGTPLKNIAPGTWTWYSPRPSCPITFQLLLNDLVWAKGQDLVLEPGGRLEVAPDFEWPEIPRFASSPTRAHRTSAPASHGPV